MKKIWFLFIASFVLVRCESLLDDSSFYDYSIEQKIDCFCPYSGNWVKLYIKSDTISNAFRSLDNQPLAYNEFKYYKSVRGLFDLITKTDTSYYFLTVIIDSLNNYPLLVYLEPKPIIIGDDTLIVVTDGQLSYTSRDYIKLN